MVGGAAAAPTTPAVSVVAAPRGSQTPDAGFVPTWYARSRSDAYLHFATTQLLPSSITNVMANIERARRDPTFHFDKNAVPPSAFASVWNQIDGFHDTSDFSMLYLMNLWYGYRNDLRSDLVAAMEQRFVAFKY